MTNITTVTLSRDLGGKTDIQIIAYKYMYCGHHNGCYEGLGIGG